MAFLNKEGLEHLWAQILMKLNGKVDKEEGKGLSTNDFTNEEKEKLAALGGNDGDCNAIIDVIELPIENIQEDCFYRLLTGTFISNGAPNTAWTCLVVDELPNVGEPVTTDMVNVFAYYNTNDNTAYGYVDSVLSDATDVPIGWYPLSALAGSFGVIYGGVISSIKDATNTETI